ncbi:sugar transferase [Clostridium gasigenes]|uniref:sugar transferase n=1 Tax=Clostridium gasigenes TaxID=94869 RepID=UPI0014382FBE|nr:sugar transferase [Clostridium gasigenes]NKF07421.1 hypothetical protein [Clostridium gasigenes]QSW17863.1 sugar transferase [Clostridium gasigenes]
MSTELNRDIEISCKRAGSFYRYSKRILDIIGALSSLILLTPILIVVGILIKLESKGAIIFAQKRVGLN